MLTESKFKEGLNYAEDNFQNENGSHLRIDKKLIREHFDLTGKRILDFGCGMGGMTLWYASNWDCEVLGLDIDSHHIEIAEHLKKKYKVKKATFKKKNILEEPLAEGTKFDFIFLNDVAEHIHLPILESIFKVFQSYLSEQGQIFVTYPPWRSPYASHVTHAVKIPWCQFLPQSMLKQMIEKNNQTIVGEIESDLLSAYDGLNHLTHKKLIQIVTKTGYQTVYRKSHCIFNNIAPLKNVTLRFFPFDFLITKEFLLLRRA